MLVMVIVAIATILYFTYKPLFKHLKAHKYSIKELFLSIQNNAEVRAEFKEFSMQQIQKLREFIDKFSKQKQQEKAQAEYKIEPNLEQQETKQEQNASSANLQADKTTPKPTDETQTQETKEQKPKE